MFTDNPVQKGDLLRNTVLTLNSMNWTRVGNNILEIAQKCVIALPSFSLNEIRPLVNCRRKATLFFKYFSTYAGTMDGY